MIAKDEGVQKYILTSIVIIKMEMESFYENVIGCHFDNVLCRQHRKLLQKDIVISLAYVTNCFRWF